jgi:hypothetical protein
MTKDEIINQLIEAQSITAERLKFDFLSKLETNIKQGSDVILYLQNFKEDFKLKLIEAFILCLTSNLIQKSDQKKYWKYIKTDDHWAALNKEALEYSLDKFEETTTDYAWIAVHLFEIYLAEEVALVESELIKNGVERSSWESFTDVIHKKWYEELNKYILKVPGGVLYGIKSEPFIGLRSNDISEEDNIMNTIENGGFD